MNGRQPLQINLSLNEGHAFRLQLYTANAVQLKDQSRDGM